jgi:enoyl-CoA hydratase
MLASSTTRSPCSGPAMLIPPFRDDAVDRDIAYLYNLLDMTTTSGPGTYTGIDDLSVELADGVLSVKMNRPDSLNSLTAAMLTTIGDTLERAASDPRVKVVRLGGAGRGFSSGAGISEEDHAEGSSSGAPADVLDAANHAVRSIVNLPQPVVAVVQGPAAGVGVSLALSADVVLASEKAFFMLAFTKIGLMPDGGASALIAAAVGRIRAMRMALMAERIPAPEAFEWGLVTAVHPADELDAEVEKLIATLVSGPAVALRKTKHAINTATLTEFEGALELEKQGQLTLLSAPDFREGTRAFQQRRTANFTDS